MKSISRLPILLLLFFHYNRLVETFQIVLNHLFLIVESTVRSKFSPCRIFGTKQISQLFFDLLKIPYSWELSIFLSKFLKNKLIRLEEMIKMISRLNENGTKQCEPSRFPYIEVVPKWKVFYEFSLYGK